MTVSRGVMAPLRREAVGVNFFNQGPTVRTRTDRIHVAAALNATVEQTLVQRKRNVATIQLAATAPNHAPCATRLVAFAVKGQVGLARHDNR